MNELNCIDSREVVNELARRDFKYFVKATKSDFKFSKFSISVCNALNDFLIDVSLGKRPILILQAPPQHGKSELVSRRFPAFAFGRYKNIRIAGCSYASDLASSMNRDLQSIMLDSSYSDIFPESTINPSRVVTIENMPQRNSERFDIINSKGYYICAGVGGPLTGKSVDIGIIDDPIKNMSEARSETVKNSILSWYHSVFLTRLSKNSGQLVMMTRWSVDDLVGTILKENNGSERLKILSFPAISEEGEALVPELHPLEQLLEMKATMTESEWFAMYQQTPIVDGGNKFKSNMFIRGPMPSEYAYTFITCDTASTSKTTSDYTVAGFWGVSVNGDERRLYLLDLLRDKIDSAQCEDYLVPFIKKHAHQNFIGALIEPKGHGIYLNQRMPQYGVPMQTPEFVDEFFRDRRFDKVARANIIIPNLVSNPIIVGPDITDKVFDECKSELLAFPAGAHDDFVDVLTDATKFTYNREVSILDVL